MKNDQGRLDLAGWATGLAGVSQLESCDLDRLCENLGLTVSLAPLKNLHGSLMREDRTFSVVLNSKDSRRRRRFTLAHEIAHLLLDGEGRLAAYNRSEVSPEANADSLERNCDQLAADILMPRAGVSAVIRGKRPSVERITELAQRYDVSIESAALRLARLTEFYCQIVKWRPEESCFVCQWEHGKIQAVTRGHTIRPVANHFGVGEAFGSETTVLRREYLKDGMSVRLVMAESQRFGPERWRYVLSVITGLEQDWKRRSHGNRPRR